MHHDGNTVGFRRTINDLQLFDAVYVIVGIKQLMGRMDLDEFDPQPNNLLHVGKNVVGVPGVYAAARNQSLRISLNIVGDELVDRRGKADHLGRHVIDQHRAIHANRVEVLQECLRRATILRHQVEILARFLHEGQRLRLEQLHRLDVNMAISDDHSQWLVDGLTSLDRPDHHSVALDGIGISNPSICHPERSRGICGWLASCNLAF